MTFEELKEICANYNLVCEEYHDYWYSRNYMCGYTFKTVKETTLVYYCIINHRVHFLPYVSDKNNWAKISESWNHKVFLIKNLKKETAIELLNYMLKKHKEIQFQKKQKEIETDFED